MKYRHNRTVVSLASDAGLYKCLKRHVKFIA